MTVQGHGWDDNMVLPAFRNVIINGGMTVAQRSTSATPFVSADGYYTADRWKTYTTNSSGSWTQSIQTDAPSGSGFTKSLRMFRTTGAAIGTYEYSYINQAIEGQNLQHFNFGNSSAKNLCISFWVKSNVVGTYTTELTTTSSRRYTATYTINVAGTWEKKTINVPKDTATTIPDSNADGMRLWFILGVGSYFSGATNPNTNTNWWTTSTPQYTPGTQVDVGLTTNNYWQITGVQLEAGSVATPFEFEPFETTLRKCQRYYQKSYDYAVVPGTNTTSGIITGSICGAVNTGLKGTTWFYKTNLRSNAIPTLYDQVGNINKVSVDTIGGHTDNLAATAYNYNDSSAGAYTNTGASGAGILLHYTVSAEL